MYTAERGGLRTVLADSVWAAYRYVPMPLFLSSQTRPLSPWLHPPSTSLVLARSEGHPSPAQDQGGGAICASSRVRTNTHLPTTRLLCLLAVRGIRPIQGQVSYTHIFTRADAHLLTHHTEGYPSHWRDSLILASGQTCTYLPHVSCACS